MDGLLQKIIPVVQNKMGYFMSVCMFFLLNFSSGFAYHKFNGVITTHISVDGLVRNIEEGQNLKSE